MNQRGREFLESVNASYRAAGGGWQGGLLYGVVYWFVRGYNRHLHPDADNISKPIWDVLKKGGAYDDDRQVCLRIAAVVDLSSERGARGTLTEPFDLTFAPPVVADAIEGLASREARGGQTSASTTGFVYIEVGALGPAMLRFGLAAADVVRNGEAGGPR